MSTKKLLETPDNSFSSLIIHEHTNEGIILLHLHLQNVTIYMSQNLPFINQSHHVPKVPELLVVCSIRYFGEKIPGLVDEAIHCFEQA